MKADNALKAIFKSYRRQFLSLNVLSFFLNLLMLTTSVYMIQVFDRVLSSGSTDTLIWLTVIVLAALLTYGFLEYARKMILSQTGSWIERELSPAVLRRSIESRLAFGRTEANLNDVSDIKAFVSGEAILAFLDTPWAILFVVLIFMMHPILGMVAIVGAILLFLIGVLNDVVTRQQQAETSRRQRELRTDSSQYVENAETLSALGMIQTVIDRWSIRHESTDADGRAARDAAAIFQNMSRVLRMILQIAILAAGAWLVLQSELSSGGMIAASIILSRALSPVERAISAWKSFGSYRIARARIETLFDTVTDPENRIALPRPDGDLALKDVRFMSPETKEPILRSISFELAAGETCGIIGPSGSGKTSLTKLLVGAWRPNFGSIRLDGAEVGEWASDDLGKFIGYLPQNIELFNGTVAENIARLGNVDEEAVLVAAKLAGAHEMILKLPNGYETQVGHFADRLSGGQKQRVGLARALYGDPSLVVLDEPNSNLDGDGELELAKCLVRLKKNGTTILLVSHLPNILKLADKVVVIKNGSVAKFGPMKEVMQDLRADTPKKPTPPKAVKVADPMLEIGAAELANKPAQQERPRNAKLGVGARPASNSPKKVSD